MNSKINHCFPSERNQTSKKKYLCMLPDCFIVDKQLLHRQLTFIYLFDVMKTWTRFESAKNKLIVNDMNNDVFDSHQSG